MYGSLKIKVGEVVLEGELTLPENPSGLIIFSHGSGSSRFSPRNRLVSQFLNKNGFGTFLFDLLTQEEDQDYDIRFDIKLLSNRLEEVTRYLLKLPEFKNLAFGYFGASTGAASALIAASKLQHKIIAVVSRGGRPDMASGYLKNVKAPTLLIVGELDFDVLNLNKQALMEIGGRKSLEIIEGATHLFEEPGTLEQVAELSLDWFNQNLKPKTKSHPVF
jgi:pimeloyl-ACP methyl ester carboxylesterase